MACAESCSRCRRLNAVLASHPVDEGVEDSVGIARQKVIFFERNADPALELACGSVLLRGFGFEYDREDEL